ncbi:MAG: hypothetical protein V7727_20955, partial [Sneathiella sp.]
AITEAYCELELARTVKEAGASKFFDKHSTGGVGDKLSLTVLPLAAAAGAKIRKLSGTSLLHCGGTIDKLSSLKGFRHVSDLGALTEESDEFGFSIGRTSPDFCAGDNLTYRVRNMVGAVSSPDLIAASIMSKKIATSPAGLVLDVKVGPGSLFSSESQAIETAQAMLEIARSRELPTRVVLTEMSSPIGRAIGGVAEVREALAFLNLDSSTEDLQILSIALASHLVEMATNCSYAQAEAKVKEVWKRGAAFHLFSKWLRHRGVEEDALQFANIKGHEIRAPFSAWIESIDAKTVGQITSEIVAQGNGNCGDITILHGVGEYVEKGEVIAHLEAAEGGMDQAISSLSSAIRYTDDAPCRRHPIQKILSN